MMNDDGDDDDDDEDDDGDDDDDDGDDDEKSMYITTWKFLEISGKIYKFPKKTTNFHIFPQNLDLILVLT